MTAPQPVTRRTGRNRSRTGGRGPALRDPVLVTITVERDQANKVEQIMIASGLNFSQAVRAIIDATPDTFLPAHSRNRTDSQAE